MDNTNNFRSIEINDIKYTRTASEIFATTKDFKNYLQPSNDFKNKMKDVGVKNYNYILGQDIVDSSKEKELQINWEIIQAIVRQQYQDNRFQFIKDSGLFTLKGDLIDKSEMGSYCYFHNEWQVNELGINGYVWIRAILSDGDLIYIWFTENNAGWVGADTEAIASIISL